MNRNYTRGSIGATMLKTAIFMLPGTLAISGYNVVDTFFVAKLGKLQLAAMGYTFPVVMLIGCVYHGIAAGIMTPVAQLMGREEPRRASKLVGAGVWLTVLISVILGVVGIATIPVVFPPMGATPEALKYINGYMIIWYVGGAVNALTMTGNQLLIATGHARWAGVSMMGGMLLNAVLDPLFIFGWGIIPGLGIVGAALATVLAQCVALIWVFMLINPRMHLVGNFRMPRRLLLAFWWTILRYGIPAALGMLLMPIGSAVTTVVVSRLGGDPAIAALAAAGRLEMLGFIFPMSLGIGLLPMIAQNYGAGYFDRVDRCRRFAMHFAFFFLVAISVLYFIFAETLSGWFCEDPEIKAIMVKYLRVVCACFAFIEIHRYSGFFFTGCGKPAVSAWLNALRILGLLTPFSLLALWSGSLEAVFYARLSADTIAGIVGCLLATRLTHRLLRSRRNSNGINGSLVQATAKP